MRVGIVLNYIRHDSTYAALRAAELLRNLGYSIAIFDKAFKSTKANLHQFWDDFVQSSKDSSFDEWTADCNVIVWFCYPSAKEIKAIKKNKKSNICVVTWDSVDTEIVSAIKNCDVLISPSKSQVKYFKEYWHLKDVVYVPVDCNWPLTVNDCPKTDYFRVVVACPGYQIKRIDHSKLFEALNKTVETCPNIQVEFLHSAKVASQIKINVTKFDKELPNGSSIRSVDDPTGWSEGPLAYGLCDVVLWPVQLESYGYVAVEALTIGTPVIAYNYVPMSEIIHDNVNGFLMNCEVKTTDLGVSYATHNGEEIVRVLSNIHANPNLIYKLRSNVHKGLEDRRKKAKLVWSEIIENTTNAR